MLKLTQLTISSALHRSIRTVTASYYKSDISIESIYPNSKQNIYTPPMPAPNKEKFNGVIPLDQLEISYERASGPGGQHVNKVATKVDLRFHVEKANWISDEVKKRLSEELKLKINKEGFLIIRSELTRYQQLNLADALEKLRNLIRQMEKPLRPEMTAETLEKIRQRKVSAANQRLVEKRSKSMTKEGRQAPKVDF